MLVVVDSVATHRRRRADIERTVAPARPFRPRGTSMLRRSSATRHALLALVTFAAIVPAARAESAPPLWWFGAGGGGFAPQGAFAGHASFEGAWELFLAHRLGADSRWGVRLSGQAVEFARSDTTYALAGIDARTRTSSQLVWLTLGPQYVVGRGPARGLLNAGVGSVWAITSTALRGATNDVGNTHVQRAAVAFEAGGGLSLDLLPSGDLQFELGGRWLRGGPLRYVPEAGIQRAAGQIVLRSREDAIDGLMLHATLAVALRGRRR
jgi:hypothetical protein